MSKPQATIRSVRRARLWITSGTAAPWTSPLTSRWADHCSGGWWCVLPLPGVWYTSVSSEASTPSERSVDLMKSCTRNVRKLMYGVSGGVRDGHVSLPGFDHLPGPWPDLRRSDHWTVVPLHSKSEFGHSLTQKDLWHQLSQTGISSNHQIHICLHMWMLLL